MEPNSIINKLKDINILEVNLLDFRSDLSFSVFDIVPFLYEGLILKEKEFKEQMEILDWSFYRNKVVSVICENEAIIPKWAYMMIMVKLKNVAAYVSFENNESLRIKFWKKNLIKESFQEFRNQRVLLKADEDVPGEIYMLATSILMGNVRTLMYGELGMPKVIYKKH